MKIFKEISQIKYEGKNSENELSFKYYNPTETILGKTMKEHLKFSMSYWHTLLGNGIDLFGEATIVREWDLLVPMDRAKMRVKAGFEIMEKLGIEYFCFHDKDIAPEGSTLNEYFGNLDIIVGLIEKEMKRTGIKLLWGTSNMFSHPRFVHGAATSCNADVFAWGAAQIKKALEITHRLNGMGFVFWGGREGYETLLNTDMGLELSNLARMLKMAKIYGDEIGFKGQFYIEPKPKEPMKHQYDFDCATVIGFLKTYDLDKYFKLNIEANHATLAGHTFQHELRIARNSGMLGSVDANMGDTLLGWDTDQFPTNIYDSTLAMYEILMDGGFKTGGLNFDAKLRRGSIEIEDIFYAYIAGMDTFAKGLRVAAKLIEDKVFENIILERYSSYQSGIGKKIIDEEIDLKGLALYAMNLKEIKNNSGRQERIESILNSYILK